MGNLQMLLIIMLFLVIGAVGLSVSLRVAECFMKKRVSFRGLFAGLHPKLFMTAGLGIFFFSLYAFTVSLISYGLNENMRQHLFNLARQYPVRFIYAGLCVFVLLSLGILVVRKLLIRIYNSRN